MNAGGAKHPAQHEPALDEKAEARGTEHWGLSTPWGCPRPQHEPAGAQRHEERLLFSGREIGVSAAMGLAVRFREALEISLIFITSLRRSVSVRKFLRKRGRHQSLLLHTRYRNAPLYVCQCPPDTSPDHCSVHPQREDWGAPPAFGSLFLPFIPLRSAARDPLTVSRSLPPSAGPFCCLLFLPVTLSQTGKLSHFARLQCNWCHPADWVIL